MTQVSEIAEFLERMAPLSLQESYDNSGLILGDESMQVTGVLVCLDCTEEIIDEAIKKNCNLVISHHPVIFKGIKRLTGKGYTERTVMKAIMNKIAVYSIHTNLDNVQNGVNFEIATRLGLKDIKILQPKEDVLRKLSVFCPDDYADRVRNSLFSAGAGNIGNYSECSFNLKGEGTFTAGENTDPFVGELGKRQLQPETRIEVIYPVWAEASILKNMIEAHPYEEVAYDIYPLSNTLGLTGSGMVGELITPEDPHDFLIRLKETMKAGVVRYTRLPQKKIHKVAVCGGSGSFLLRSAIRSGADLFITADFKYHEFFDADGKIIIADIGHYESEQFTVNLLSGWISKNFNTFAVHFAETNTNPINYL
jgi:dinuclear metal center YbgI/SA1388 family protein